MYTTKDLFWSNLVNKSYLYVYIAHEVITKVVTNVHLLNASVLQIVKVMDITARTFMVNILPLTLAYGYKGMHANMYYMYIRTSTCAYCSTHTSDGT